MHFAPVVLDYVPLEAPGLLSVNDLSDDLIEVGRIREEIIAGGEG